MHGTLLAATVLCCTGAAAALRTPTRGTPTRRAIFGGAAALVCVPGAALAAPDELDESAAGTAAAARVEEPTEPRKYENWLDNYAYKPGTPIGTYLKDTYGLRTREEILAPLTLALPLALALTLALTRTRTRTLPLTRTLTLTLTLPRRS